MIINFVLENNEIHVMYILFLYINKKGNGKYKKRIKKNGTRGD